MKKVALIVAGGIGARMNTGKPKQFLLLKGIPILIHTLKQFSHLEDIFLVLPSTQFDYWDSLCNSYNFTLKHSLISGGETRFQSVKNGLEKVDSNSIVAIHDGVRPLVSASLINSLISQTKVGVGVIPIIPIKDSIRKVLNDDSVAIDRARLVKVQTPQCFISSEIKEAYRQDYSDKFTDDASVFQANGGQIITVLGEENNLKITTEEDLKIASFMLF